jgi:hypothetical protein
MYSPYMPNAVTTCDTLASHPIDEPEPGSQAQEPVSEDAQLTADSGPASVASDAATVGSDITGFGTHVAPAQSAAEDAAVAAAAAVPVSAAVFAAGAAQSLRSALHSSQLIHDSSWPVLNLLLTLCVPVTAYVTCDMVGPRCACHHQPHQARLFSWSVVTAWSKVSSGP